MLSQFCQTAGHISSPCLNIGICGEGGLLPCLPQVTSQMSYPLLFPLFVNSIFSPYLVLQFLFLTFLVFTIILTFSTLGISRWYFQALTKWHF